MGIFDNLLKPFGKESKEIDIEQYMGSDEMENVDVMNEPADMYVKPVAIASEEDLKLIEEELSKKNIILMNLEEVSKRPTTKTNIINALKAYILKINGDIAMIDDMRILLTPEKVKIIKKKKTMK